MRKRLPAAVALAVATGGLLGGPAAAGSGEARVHTLEYVGGGLRLGPTQSAEVRVGDGIGAVSFRGGPERYVSIEVDDAHGQPVAAIVAQPDEDHHICGATDKPLKIVPYEKVTVFLMNGVCGHAGASAATTGTVTATFTKTR